MRKLMVPCILSAVLLGVLVLIVNNINPTGLFFIEPAVKEPPPMKVNEVVLAGTAVPEDEHGCDCGDDLTANDVVLLRFPKK